MATKADKRQQISTISHSPNPSPEMSMQTQFEEDVAFQSSWWYTFCKRWHPEDEKPESWQPPFWRKLCPYPVCPTYRHFAQITALAVLLLLIWGVMYSLIGDMVAPGSQLFQLSILTLAAHLGGWFLLKSTNLPALIGMLIVGIVMQNTGLISFDKDFAIVPSRLRKFSLVIIMTRAGLHLDPKAMRRLILAVMKLGIIPWLIECIVIAIITHYLLQLPWWWSFLLGSIIAAVSPAVVVPCLFRLQLKGYGVAKGIPTLVLAASGIDDATSVAIFGIISSIMFTSSSLAFTIIQGPLSIIGGIGFGILWGYLLKYVPEKNDPFVIPLRVLILLFGGLISVLGTEILKLDGAGPLAVVTSAFVASINWSQDENWNVEHNSVSTCFQVFWVVFEPILFGLTGAQVKINELDPNIVYLAIACLVVGVVIRVTTTIVVGIGCNLNNKEKFFIGLTWMAKATVQAALGPVALDIVSKDSNSSEEDFHYAKIVLVTSILSIILTAPLGAVLITTCGPRLLTRLHLPTKQNSRTSL